VKDDDGVSPLEVVEESIERSGDIERRGLEGRLFLPPGGCARVSGVRDELS
jgi:hypothetical protein